MLHHNRGVRPEGNDQHVDMAMLKVPRHEQSFVSEINEEVNKLRERIAEALVHELTANGGSEGNKLSYWRPANKQHREQVQDDVKKFIEDKIQHYLNNEPPLFQSYEMGSESRRNSGTLVVPPSSRVDIAQTVCTEQRERAIREAVEETVTNFLKNAQKAEYDTRQTFLKNPWVAGKHGVLDVDRMIRESNPPESERILAKQLGLDQPISLSSPRNMLIASFWGSHALAAAAIYMLPKSVAIPVIAGLTVFNAAVQAIKGIAVNNKTAVLLDRVVGLAEKSKDMETALFWTSHLAKIVQDVNPLLVGKNRTDLLNSETGMNIDTLLLYLKGAAEHAGEMIGKRAAENSLEVAARDSIFDSQLGRAKPELAALANRWRAPSNHYLEFSGFTAAVGSLIWLCSL